MAMIIDGLIILLLTACKQYCLAAGATQGNIAYTQTVKANGRTRVPKKIGRVKF
jgi:hypothetical protein